MSSEETNDAEDKQKRFGSSLRKGSTGSISNSALKKMHKVHERVKTNVKKTKENAKFAVRRTEENIKGATANATAMIERTIHGSTPTTSTSSTDGGGTTTSVEFDQDSTKEAAEWQQSYQSNASQADGSSPKSASAADFAASRSSSLDYLSKESFETIPETPEITEKPQEDSRPNKEEAFELKKNITTMEELQPDRLAQNPSVIAAILALFLAAYKAFANHSEIWDNIVPVHVALTWAALALVVGVEIGRRQAAKEFREYLKIQSTIYEKAGKHQPAHGVHPQQHHPSRGRASSQEEDDDDYDRSPGPNDPHHFRRIRKMVSKVQRRMHRPRPSWTTLGADPTRKRQRWERNGNVLVSKSLTRALGLRAPATSIKSLEEMGVSERELSQAMEDDKSLFLGSFDDPERMVARSLGEKAIEPLFRLRGMDVFLTEDAEYDLANHPFLIENGLRDRPTFIINALTPWGNICMYFEMPSWITSWDHFEEKEDDPEDVIALKRFLNGDDEYRNGRFKCLPVLVDGPGPIKYIAPPKVAVTVVTPNLSSSWRFHPPKVDENDKTVLHPCLELECKMCSRAHKSVAAVVKRYLVWIVGDCALLIEKPWGQKEDEPRACVGTIRFDRIDISTCPEMPPRTPEQEGDSTFEEELEEGDDLEEEEQQPGTSVSTNRRAISGGVPNTLRQARFRQTA